MTEEPTQTKNASRNRYELHLGGELIGQIDYRLADGVVDMFHTEVDPAHGGRGYGHRIVAFALADAADAGLKVRPTCPFISTFMDRSEEFRHLRA
ncbi:GNAT family N-acetyltransferase [Tessaracoccus sp. Z1128]